MPDAILDLALETAATPAVGLDLDRHLTELCTNLVAAVRVTAAVVVVLDPRGAHGSDGDAAMIGRGSAGRARRAGGERAAVRAPDDHAGPARGSDRRPWRRPRRTAGWSAPASSRCAPSTGRSARCSCSARQDAPVDDGHLDRLAPLAGGAGRTVGERRRARPGHATPLPPTRTGSARPAAERRHRSEDRPTPRGARPAPAAVTRSPIGVVTSHRALSSDYVQDPVTIIILVS